jgi:putative endonuclease
MINSSETTGWYLYIIETKHLTLYTGITTDIERRFEQHKSGKGAKFLRGKTPLKKVFEVNAGDRSEASKWEMKIKKLTKTKKEQLIDVNPTSLAEYFNT